MTIHFAKRYTMHLQIVLIMVPQKAIDARENSSYKMPLSWDPTKIEEGMYLICLEGLTLLSNITNRPMI
jgi:hypothetical protein